MELKIVHTLHQDVLDLVLSLASQKAGLEPVKKRKPVIEDEDDDDPEEKPAKPAKGSGATRKKPAPVVEDEDDEPEEEEQPKPKKRSALKTGTIEDARNQASKAMDRGKKSELQKLLKEYGVVKVSDLDPSDYAEFSAACKEL